MAWTTPRTWVTSEIVTAALLNTHIRDNQNYIKGNADAGTTFDGYLIVQSGVTGAGVQINSLAAGGGLTAFAVHRQFDNNRLIAYRLLSQSGAHEWSWQQPANSNDTYLSEVGVSNAWSIAAGANGAFNSFRPLNVSNSATQSQFIKDCAIVAAMYQNAQIQLQSSAAGYPALGFHKFGVSAGTLYHKSYTAGEQLRWVSAADGIEQIVWTSACDGAGSGLDADLLDGINSSGFMQLAGADQTVAGIIRADQFFSVHATASLKKFAFDTANYMYIPDPNRIGFATNATQRMVIETAGYSGAGGIHVAGDVMYTGSTVHESDRQLKRSITPLSPILDQFVKIQPVAYHPNEMGLRFGLPDRDEVGFIAQDIEALFPELVHTAIRKSVEINYDDDGIPIPNEEVELKAINTSDLIPYMVQAIKELYALQGGK